MNSRRAENRRLLCGQLDLVLVDIEPPHVGRGPKATRDAYALPASSSHEEKARMHDVKIATGTVTHGTIVVEGQSFSEGEKVTVLSYADREPFRVSPEEKRLLLESIGQADRGEFVDAEALFAELDESN